MNSRPQSPKAKELLTKMDNGKENDDSKYSAEENSNDDKVENGKENDDSKNSEEENSNDDKVENGKEDDTPTNSEDENSSDDKYIKTTFKEIGLDLNGLETTKQQIDEILQKLSEICLQNKRNVEEFEKNGGDKEEIERMVIKQEVIEANYGILRKTKEKTNEIKNMTLLFATTYCVLCDKENPSEEISKCENIFSPFLWVNSECIAISEEQGVWICPTCFTKNL